MPPSTFSEHLPSFWPHLLSEKVTKLLLAQNLGDNGHKKCKISCCVGSMDEKYRVCFLNVLPPVQY